MVHPLTRSVRARKRTPSGCFACEASRRAVGDAFCMGYVAGQYDNIVSESEARMKRSTELPQKIDGFCTLHQKLLLEHLRGYVAVLGILG